MLFCKGFIDLPKPLPDHVRAARLVRMGQVVAAWRRAVAYLGERPRVVAQAVADVVQVQGMGQVDVQHGHHMAVGAEGARLDFVRTGRILDNSVRYPTCQSAQERS